MARSQPREPVHKHPCPYRRHGCTYRVLSGPGLAQCALAARGAHQGHVPLVSTPRSKSTLCQARPRQDPVCATMSPVRAWVLVDRLPRLAPCHLGHLSKTGPGTLYPEMVIGKEFVARSRKIFSRKRSRKAPGKSYPERSTARSRKILSRKAPGKSNPETVIARRAPGAHGPGLGPRTGSQGQGQ